MQGTWAALPLRTHDSVFRVTEDAGRADAGRRRVTCEFYGKKAISKAPNQPIPGPNMRGSNIPANQHESNKPSKKAIDTRSLSRR